MMDRIHVLIIQAGNDIRNIKSTVLAASYDYDYIKELSDGLFNSILVGYNEAKSFLESKDLHLPFCQSKEEFEDMYWTQYCDVQLHTNVGLIENLEGNTDE